MKKIEENNKLIAEFMGIHEIMLDEYSNYEIDDIYQILGMKPHMYKNMVIHESDLQFHTSWDWLMPVVSKCYDNSEEADGKDTNVVGDISHHLLDVDMEQTYKAVVEFIKWYNENN